MRRESAIPAEDGAAAQKPRFMLFYPPGRAPALLKDPGQIPWHLSRRGTLRAIWVSHPNSPTYDSIATDEDFEIRLPPRSRSLFGVSLSALAYLWRHAPEVDVLNLYHLRPETLLHALLFRARNRRGVLYLKTDLDAVQYSLKRPRAFLGGTFRDQIRKTLFQIHLDHIAPWGLSLFDLISGETHSSVRWLREQFPRVRERILWVPNGINLPEESPVTPSARRHTILTVGRLGSWQKNTELLIDAAAAANLGDWHVVFCGPTESGIEEYAREKLGDRAEFTGPIYDREKLFTLFRQAGCFCLTSRGESFAFVLLEAFACGAYILSTDVGVFRDLIANPRDGTAVRDADSLRSALEAVVNGSTGTEVSSEDRIKIVRETYTWEVIVEKLEAKLLEVMRERGALPRARSGGEPQ